MRKGESWEAEKYVRSRRIYSRWRKGCGLVRPTHRVSLIDYIVQCATDGNNVGKEEAVRHHYV